MNLVLLLFTENVSNSLQLKNQKNNYNKNNNNNRQIYKIILFFQKLLNLTSALHRIFLQLMIILKIK